MLLVDRTSPIPLYHQLKQIFADKIDGAEWQVGDLIPSELELQEAYGLSRTTVRLALGELVTEGRLVRQRGRGTFVAAPKLTHDPASGKSLSEYLLKKGNQPSWKVLSRDWAFPSDVVRERLLLAEGVGVYRVELLFLTDNTPIGHHTVFVPQHVTSEIDHATFDDNAWLAFLRNLPTQDGNYTRRTIEAVNLTTDIAALLGIDPRDPVLSIEALTLNSAETPVLLIQAYFNGQRFKYQLKS